MTKVVLTKPHIISDNEGHIAIPITQQQSILPQPHLIEDDMNAVLDTTAGELLEYCYRIKSPDKVL